MAKMTLPTTKTVTYPTAQQASPTGPVILAPQPDPDAAEDAVRDLSVSVEEGEVVEGMTTEVVTSAKQLREMEDAAQRAKQVYDRDKGAQAYETAKNGQTLSPRLAADDIAKLEELSRTMLEIRGIAVAAQTHSSGMPAQIAKALADVQNTVGEFLGINMGVVTKRVVALETSAQDLERRHNSLTVAMSVSDKALENDHKDLVATINEYQSDLDDEVAMLRSRLDAVDTMLASHGLPTTATAASKPVLKLHPRRRLVHEAKLDGDAVVLYYNPRQGHDGHDEQEFPLSKDNVRNVWVGYSVEVPPGYICDVFIDADVICSKTGRDDSEFLLKAVTRGARRIVCSGGEICRLTLRRIEALRLEVVR